MAKQHCEIGLVGRGLSNDTLHSVYDRWNQTELNGFPVEITTRILDPHPGHEMTTCRENMGVCQISMEPQS